MNFIRHVGKQADRKVAIIFREVPGEPHMCLVTYTETLNQHIHDPLIKCIESDIGQNSKELADALNRTLTHDGRPILQLLHMEGLLKKVNTEQIVVTPNSSTKLKLSELNKILNEMQQGEQAVKRMAELDQSRGLQDPADVARRLRGDQPSNERAQTASTAQGLLGDNDLANNLRQQAAKMSAEAKGLMAEAERLLKEAAGMDPMPAIKETAKAKKTTTKKTKVSA